MTRLISPYHIRDGHFTLMINLNFYWLLFVKQFQCYVTFCSSEIIIIFLFSDTARGNFRKRVGGGGDRYSRLREGNEKSLVD